MEPSAATSVSTRRRHSRIEVRIFIVQLLSLHDRNPRSLVQGSENCHMRGSITCPLGFHDIRSTRFQRLPQSMAFDSSNAGFASRILISIGQYGLVPDPSGREHAGCGRGRAHPPVSTTAVATPSTAWPTTARRPWLRELILVSHGLQRTDFGLTCVGFIP